MVSVKMNISGMYNGVVFKKGDVVEFSEDALKGLDVRDYSVVEKPSEEEEKQVEKSSDKMQRPRGKK